MRKTLVASAVTLALTQTYAQEVSSIRSSQYEWTCETGNGEVISGHTRQDKAFQSCYNQALEQPGVDFQVRGGTFRVSATSNIINPEPGPEPNPEPGPEPPIEPDPTPDPTPVPLVTFGLPNPITGPVRFPNTISALRQDSATWRGVFTLNSLTDRQGLWSMDETGQDQPGHLSVYVWPDGRLQVRHQNISSGQVSLITPAGSIVANTEYEVEISIDTNDGIGLFLDGELIDFNPVAFGTSQNPHELVVGGLCVTCTDPDRVITFPIDGQISLEIWDDPIDIPQPGAATLKWTAPVKRENGVPLTIDELGSFNIFEGNVLVTTVEGDIQSYEYVGSRFGEHCFTITAVDTNGLESNQSNQECKEL